MSVKYWEDKTVIGAWFGLWLWSNDFFQTGTIDVTDKGVRIIVDDQHNQLGIAYLPNEAFYAVLLKEEIVKLSIPLNALISTLSIIDHHESSVKVSLALYPNHSRELWYESVSTSEINVIFPADIQWIWRAIESNGRTRWHYSWHNDKHSFTQSGISLSTTWIYYLIPGSSLRFPERSSESSSDYEGKCSQGCIQGEE